MKIIKFRGKTPEGFWKTGNLLEQDEKISYLGNLFGTKDNFGLPKIKFEIFEVLSETLEISFDTKNFSKI